MKHELNDWEFVADNGNSISEKEVRVTIEWTKQIKFWLNGEEQILRNPSPSLLLVDWLREKKGLTGTKVGCGEGGCGICTVAMSFEAPGGAIETVSINSCLRRVCALDGVHITTTEGLGGQGKGFHPIQKAIADGNGSQCGYCTPGWVMNMYALLQKKSDPSREEVEQHFDGNLCRCTGYRPILNAFGEFAKGGKCSGQHHCISHPADMLERALEPLHFSDALTGDEWYRPLSLAQLSDVRKTLSSKKKIQLLCANTSAGVTKYLLPQDTRTETAYVDITKIPELTGSSFDQKGITFGANVPLAEVIVGLEKHLGDAPFFGSIAEHLKRVASVQIRNVGSWAGNIMLTREAPEFASDVALVLSTAAAMVTVLDSEGSSRIVSIPELLTSKGDLTVVSMNIPLVPSTSLFRTYKTAQRHVFAHAIVNLGVYCAFDDKEHVTAARIIVGGATQTLCVASKTADAIVGRMLDHETFTLAAKALVDEITANPSSDERHSAEYRLDLAQGFLYKAFLAKSSSLPMPLQSTQDSFVPADARPVSCGTESYGIDPEEGPIGQYIPKLKSRKQASGEAFYTSDAVKGRLFGQIVLSTTAKAKLVSLDPGVAMTMPGVVDFVCAKDVPGLNCVDSVDGKGNLCEKAFWEVGDLIPCVGSVLGVIVADSWAHARQAAKAVVQKYSSHERVVTSLDEAERLGRMPTQQDIEDACESLKKPGNLKQRRLHEKFANPFSAPWTVEDTTPSAEATQSLQGEVIMGWQYHFYMETQTVMVSPVDGDCFDVLCATQWQQLTQSNIALLLKVPAKNINVKTYQIGGAFGGKISRNLILTQAIAVAAHKLKATVFAQNERSDDMHMFTGRDFCSYRYTVNFEPSGKVDTMDATMMFGPGYFLGDAAGDAAMGVQFADDCYSYRKFKLGTKTFLTDVSHTGSCRAPGAMNASVFAQVVMEHIAKKLGKTTEEVQELNFYKEGDKTPFGDEIGKDGYNFTVPLMWKKLQADTDYLARKAAIAKYNSENRWTKKGIAVTPVKYCADQYAGGTGFHLGVLIDVYSDGSVLISHGGIELGQGINTKAILVAANTLKIPIDKIRVGPSETSKTPNGVATGGSGTSETICAGVIKACQMMNDRLKPYIVDKALSWDDAITAALADNVNLMASSWQVWEQPKNGNAHPYATYGVGAAEVLVDILTGEVRVERMDILMDLGTQLDAATDIGQLQGGFIMALGWLLSEELRWNTNGTQLNLGSWEYKIPTAYDIPVQFNVSLLKDVPNQSPTAVKGSKLQSEPAMALVASVLLAIKQALYAARQANGVGGDWFQVDAPLTPENVRKYCGTSVDQFVIPKTQ